MYLTSNYFDIKNYDQPNKWKNKFEKKNQHKTFNSEHSSARIGMWIDDEALE